MQATDTELLTFLDAELDDQIECEAFQCLRAEWHAADWVVTLSCRHRVFGCEVARQRWNLLDALIVGHTWDCPTCQAKTTMTAIYPVRQP